MHILIVGNCLKDVYLNLDDRTEKFETDKNETKWLNLAFNASEHHFFNRESNLGGAAVTMETLTKLGLEATINNSDLKVEPEGLTSNQPAETYRYIFISDDQPCYFVPTLHAPTIFQTPTDFYDYVYIDRSALLNEDSLKQINSYLRLSTNTRLVIYLKNTQDKILTSLLPRADLVFLEENSGEITNSQIPDSKLIHLSENYFSHLETKESISPQRVDLLTHLSFYSIASATILGCFILEKTVKESLHLAKINVENSKLNTTLSLSQLESLAQENSNYSANDLELVASSLVLKPKGILAADESGGSIHKKFENLKIDDTYDNRRDYRNVLFTTPNLEQYVNGVILFDETARQTADDGQTFAEYLTSKRIIPGIKVDQGLEKFPGSEETFTKGLEGLDSRLSEYYQMGLRFAKWRAAFEVRLDENGNLLTPTEHAINENCRILAEYAKKCQENNLVPIVEPELVYDGNYSIEQSATITSQILDSLFNALRDSHVNFKACLLKVNMILAGKQFDTASTPAENGIKTAEVLKNHVPADLAGVVFLSGGQTPEQATENLDEILKNGPFPWPVTFSFARALQDPALYAWVGDNNNTKIAQDAFTARLKANCETLKKAE